MKTLKPLFLLWLGIFFCWSCSSEEDMAPEQVAKIELSSTQLPVLQEGGTYNMTFTASADWKAEVDETRSASWLSIEPMSGGAGTVTLSVTATSNETYDERNATVTLISGAARENFVVNQKQKDALMVTSNKVEVSSVGGGIEIEVKANISFESEVEQPAQEWITPVVTRGLTTSTLLFDVKENESQEKREGKIVIRSGEFVETVTVYQEGSKPTIVLTQDAYTVSSNGESIKVELRSNIDYEVQLPDVDWLTETVTRAFSTHTYYFTISPNDTYDARTTNIVFFNKAENLSDTVTVTQMQKDAIIVAQNEYTVDANGGNLEFDVNTNVEFTVEIADSWIKQQTESRGLVTKPLYFVVEANTDSEKREGTINIISGDLKQTVKVVQNSVVERERAALIEFYKATNGDNWIRNDNWCSDRPLDEWYGVATDPQTKQVISLELPYNNLTGTIPESIGDLTGLRYLNLETNNIGGELPATLGSLRQIICIYLNGNKLSGDIPASVTNLPTWGENCLEAIMQNDTYFNFSTTNLKLPTFNKTDIMTSAPINNVDILKEKELTIVYLWSINNNDYKRSVSALYERFKDYGLNILAVSREGVDESALKSYIQDNNMDSWHHITTSGINWAFWPPSILVFDSNSECLYYDHYEFVIGKNLETIIKERLGEGKLMYESTDYSKDGEYKLLQKATQGRGIDLIFMGEAFADIDMASGLYEQTMQDAVEQFFSIEPYKSFRNRFNAYMVNVVSPNNEFREDAVHRINGNNAVCFEYAQKVPGVNTEKSYISVIYSSFGFK